MTNSELKIIRKAKNAGRGLIVGVDTLTASSNDGFLPLEYSTYIPLRA